MTQVIPLLPVPSQVLNVQLGEQLCRIRIYARRYGLFCDLYVNDTLIIGGVLCLNLVKIVRSAYLGFEGDLAFNDTQGNSDPIYTGLGDRFVLLWLESDDV